MKRIILNRYCFIQPQIPAAGFTLIELLLAFAIIILLIAAALPLYSNLQLSAQLNESTEQLIQTLRLARMRSVERYNDSSHGVSVQSNSNAPDRIVLYQGISYATRNTAYDRVTTFDDALSLTPLLSGGAIDITFSKAGGRPSATGTITITHATSGARSISINAIGRVAHE